MTRQKSFESHITQRDGLLYIHLKQAPVPPGRQLSINETTTGQIAMIAPTTMTSSGPQPMRGGNTDIWMINNEGFNTLSEFTNDSDEQCSHHTAPIAPSIQINLRTTGRPSSNNQVNQQQKSPTASETQPRRTTDSLMDQHGSEKHGSNPSRVHQQSSRPNQQQQR